MITLTRRISFVRRSNKTRALVVLFGERTGHAVGVELAQLIPIHRHIECLGSNARLLGIFPLEQGPQHQGQRHQGEQRSGEPK